MFKLAHISDIHLGPMPHLTFRELASKRITGYVNWHRNRAKHMGSGTLDALVADINAQAPDHLTVTGDLVNLASGLEINKATDWLRRLGKPDTISVVPGNHDAYVPGAHEKAMHAWYDYVRGDTDPETWRKEFKLWPTLRRRGPVALIGCSTSIATPPFSASGYFSSRQARETAQLLREAGEEGLFRVVLIHHPPIRGAASQHKRMIGIRRFAAAVSLGGAELVLHGHTHLNTLNWLHNRHGRVPVVGIASASQGPGGSKPPAAYNLFSISGDKGAWVLDWERHTVGEDGKPFSVSPSQRLSG